MVFFIIIHTHIHIKKNNTLCPSTTPSLIVDLPQVTQNLFIKIKGDYFFLLKYETLTSSRGLEKYESCFSPLDDSYPRQRSRGAGTARLSEKEFTIHPAATSRLSFTNRRICTPV